jgi:hypothetical protein
MTSREPSALKLARMASKRKYMPEQNDLLLDLFRPAHKGDDAVES